MMDPALIEKTHALLVHQLRNWWLDALRQVIPTALEQMEKNYSAMLSKRFFDGEHMVFNPVFSVTWMIFLYRVSRLLFQQGYGHEADCVYYLNKIMHANDWFYQIDWPVHFMAEHPLGSVLGKAVYGDFLFVYQSTTVGGNRKNDTLYYHVLGNNVVLYANATVLGNTHIGNNVIVSANSYLIDADIPDNCLVFGKSPDLKIVIKSEEEMKKRTRHLWNWGA